MKKVLGTAVHIRAAKKIQAMQLIAQSSLRYWMVGARFGNLTQSAYQIAVEGDFADTFLRNREVGFCKLIAEGTPERSA